MTADLLLVAEHIIFEESSSLQRPEQSSSKAASSRQIISVKHFEAQKIMDDEGQEVPKYGQQEKEQSFCLYNPGRRQMSVVVKGASSALGRTESSSSIASSRGASDSSDTLGDEYDEEVEAHVASVFSTEESKIPPVEGPSSRDSLSTSSSASSLTACGCGHTRVRRKRSMSGGASTELAKKDLGTYDAAAAAAAVTAALRERGMATSASYVWMPAAVSRTYGGENNSMIDRRAWLEVEDRKHRYAKNLRAYYKEWDKRGKPGDSFWTWLDEDKVEVSE